MIIAYAYIMTFLLRNQKKRIPYTLVLCAIVILFQVVLAIVNSEDWPFTFFVLTLISAFVMFG